MRSLAPFFTGRGLGRGAASTNTDCVVSPPHPKFATRISTSPRKRGEVDRASRQTDSYKSHPALTDAALARRPEQRDVAIATARLDDVADAGERQMGTGHRELVG